jgi:chromosome segregation ATPase
MSKVNKSPIPNLPSKNEPTLTDIMKILKSQDNKLSTISSKLIINENKTDVIMIKLEELTSDIAKLRKENEELKTQIDTLRTRVNVLDTSTNNRNGKDLDLQTILLEVHERTEKSNNIIIFNVEEELTNSETNPVNRADTILKELDLNISIVHTARLGKMSSKPRPLMVKLKSTSEVMSVLKAKRKLRSIDSLKHIFIGTDLTTLQRTHFNDIKHQLEEKRKLGEDGWFIKYINGTPTLAKKNSGK